MGSRLQAVDLALRHFAGQSTGHARPAGEPGDLEYCRIHHGAYADNLSDPLW